MKPALGVISGKKRGARKAEKVCPKSECGAVVAMVLAASGAATNSSRAAPVVETSFSIRRKSCSGDSVGVIGSTPSSAGARARVSVALIAPSSISRRRVRNAAGSAERTSVSDTTTIAPVDTGVSGVGVRLAVCTGSHSVSVWGSAAIGAIATA